MKQFFALISKDFKLHLLHPEIPVLQFFMSVTLFLVLKFADLNGLLEGNSANGFFWAVFFIMSNLALNRLAQVDFENNAVIGIILSGVGTLKIFLSRQVFLLIYSLIAYSLGYLCFALMFGIDLSIPKISEAASVLAILLGFNAVIFTTTTVLSGLKFNEFIVPLVSLPLQVPILLAAIAITSYGDVETSNWTMLVIAYDLCFLTLGAVLHTIFFD